MDLRLDELPAEPIATLARARQLGHKLAERRRRLAVPAPILEDHLSALSRLRARPFHLRRTRQRHRIADRAHRCERDRRAVADRIYQSDEEDKRRSMIARFALLYPEPEKGGRGKRSSSLDSLAR
jgi:hypothetical protein